MFPVVACQLVSVVLPRGVQIWNGLSKHMRTLSILDTFSAFWRIF